MGVVRRQSVKHAIVNFAGLGIGGLSVLFLYPHVKSEYGLMQILLQIGMVGLPIWSLGANTVVFRFFPRFEDKASGHHGFLGLLILMCVAGSLFAGLAGLAFWPGISDYLSQKSPLLHRYLWMAWPIAFCYVLSVIFSQYSANFNRIVAPTILLEFSQKLILPILLGAYWFGWITLDTALWGLLGYSLLVPASLALYLQAIGQWRPRFEPGFITPALRKEMIQFILFGAFGGFALLLLAKSDFLMVGARSSLAETGIYAIAAFLAATIDIPTKSLYGASIAILSKHLNEDNRAAMGELYQKVSINLLLAGLLVFGAIWVSVDAIFRILPKGEELSAGKYVLLFIGLSRIVEMGTGLNNYMVYYSAYYRYSLISLALLAAGNIALGLWLIPIIGITGAAVSTLAATALYNAFNVGLVWYLFGLQPFTGKSLYAIALALGAYVVCAALPPFHSVAWVDAVLRSGLYITLFMAPAVYWRFSPEITDGLKLLINKLKK